MTENLRALLEAAAAYAAAMDRRMAGADNLPDVARARDAYRAARAALGTVTA